MLDNYIQHANRDERKTLYRLMSIEEMTVSINGQELESIIIIIYWVSLACRNVEVAGARCRGRNTKTWNE